MALNFDTIFISLVLGLSILIAFKVALFPRGPLRFHYLYRFFVLYKIVVLAGFSLVIIHFSRDANFVLKSSDFSRFYVPSLALLVFFLIFYLISIYFERVEIAQSKISSWELERPRKLPSWLPFLTLVSMLVLILNVSTLVGLPQRELFSGLSAQELAMIRVNEIHNGGWSIFRNILGRDLSIFLTLASIYYFVACRSHRFRVLALLSLNMIASLYFNTIELSKSGLVEVIIYFSLFYITVQGFCHSRRISIFLGATLGVLSLLAVILMFVLVFPHKELFQIIVYLGQRVFISQMSGFVFTATTDFRSSVGVLDIFGYLAEVFRVADYTAPGQHITKNLFPEAFAAGRMNYISSIFLSDAYWLGGWWAMVFASFHVTLMLRFMIYLSIFGRPRPFMMILSGFVIFGSNLNSSYLPFIMSTSVVFIILIMLPFCRRISWKWIRN